ncbi:homoserine O-acetyltransferase [Ekhidna sp.]|uniref:homoserine O-acetyltransferase family protein n=1 Tax=Ekhidna sp. TaxID=2608089 RepID=UPI003297B503
MKEIQYQSNSFQIKVVEPLDLESGDTLQDLRIQYHTVGTLNSNKSNVVWIFHALTANSDPAEWWPGIIAHENPIDLQKDFIICANVIGSCYGSTEPEGFEFPVLSVKDLVSAHQVLRDQLGISKIKLGIGGSLGGQQLLEWAVQEPELFEVIVPLATNAKHSAWGIAFNEAQRMALRIGNVDKGLSVARAIAMLSYRNYQTYEKTQTDMDHRVDSYSASSYQNHQGEKLRNRFSFYSYYYLSKAMDSHDVGRHFGGIEKALKRIKSKVISIGISSDILFPVQEQKLIAEYTQHGVFHAIESLYGHDGFLLEVDQINQILKKELS